MLNVECWMLDVGCWMLDVECWMLDDVHHNPAQSLKKIVRLSLPKPRFGNDL
jgi:hypothetical protein